MSERIVIPMPSATILRTASTEDVLKVMLGRSPANFQYWEAVWLASSTVNITYGSSATSSRVMVSTDSSGCSTGNHNRRRERKSVS